MAPSQLMRRGGGAEEKIGGSGVKTYVEKTHSSNKNVFPCRRDLNQMHSTRICMSNILDTDFDIIRPIKSFVELSKVQKVMKNS